MATIDDDHTVNIGGVKVLVDGFDGWRDGTVAVYVRRLSTDLSVIEIAMAGHDGLCEEELQAKNAEAECYPLGPKEYWRAEMVGKNTYGPDRHLMTDEEFEAEWFEQPPRSGGAS